jgi:hypothetical protein
MVPRGRLELPNPCGHRILSPTRLPVPPPGPACMGFKRNSQRQSEPKLKRDFYGEVTPSSRSSFRTA